MKKPLVYIAAPMSLPPGQQFLNVRRALHVAETLRKLGFIPLVPQLHFVWEMVGSTAAYDDWMEIDKQYILRCDALYRTSGESKGADIEVVWAREHYIPVFTSYSDMLKHFRNADDPNLYKPKYNNLFSPEEASNKQDG